MRTHQLVLQWIEGQLSSGQRPWGAGFRPSARSPSSFRSPAHPSARPSASWRPWAAPGPEWGSVRTRDRRHRRPDHGAGISAPAACGHLAPARQGHSGDRVLLESWAATRARPESPALAEAARLLEQMDKARDGGVPCAGCPLPPGPGGCRGQRRSQRHDGLPARGHPGLCRTAHRKPAGLERHCRTAPRGTSGHPGGHHPSRRRPGGAVGGGPHRGLLRGGRAGFRGLIRRRRFSDRSSARSAGRGAMLRAGFWRNDNRRSMVGA